MSLDMLIVANQHVDDAGCFCRLNLPMQHHCPVFIWIRNNNAGCFLQAESTSATNESVLKMALEHGKAAGFIKSHDRVVVCQKVGDASVVKIIELED